MSFRRRTFPEVLDNLLTDVAGGVAGETHPFPPPDGASPGGVPPRYSLEQPPVAQVVSVYGRRDGQPYRFRNDSDFRLLADGQTLEWPEGAELPDPGTLFSVNYFPQAAQPLLTDLQTGSVVRTLAESVGLEIARLYAQLEAVQDAGFVDTASGSALNNVVALLGIRRVTGGRATGEVRFTRAAGSRGTITIPAGTRVLTESGDVEYETTESVTLAEAQTTILAPVRDLENNEPLAADALTVLAVPIAGVAAVTNPAPTSLSARDETDVELRTRAKNFLHGSERATLGALRQAITRQGLTADVEEVADTPGFVVVTPHAEVLPPELQQRLLAAIRDARPAGVVVTLAGAVPPKRVDLALRLTTRTDLTEQDLRAAHRAVSQRLQDYFQRLPAGQPGSINRIVGLVLGVPEVEDVRLISATLAEDGSDVLDSAAGELAIGGFPTVLGELQIADPNLPTLLNVVVSFPGVEEAPDKAQIEAALSAALNYLNTLNAVDAPADPTLVALDYGRLLLPVPLPNKAAVSLQDFDQTPGAVPDETTIAPYRIGFALTQANGLTRLLETAADPPYTLTPFERLSLDAVTVRAE